MPILDDIVANKKIEVTKLKQLYTHDDFARQIKKIYPPKDFLKAVSVPLSLIAEVKKASPSAGIISGNFDPRKTALLYEKAGAKAISVITESKYFLGDISHLKDISGHVKIPVLRKDFIIDEIQIYESRLNGADAILLIAAILNDEQLNEFAQISDKLGMAQIIEVHNSEELGRALKISPKIIGINNRDLKTFKVNYDTTFELAKLIPRKGENIIISESGIKDPSQMKRLYDAGINAVLMGEELMRSHDTEAKIKKLFKW